MPNWVRNIIAFDGPDSSIHKMLKRLRNKNSVIDFNKIKKMPDSLNTEHTHNLELCTVIYACTAGGVPDTTFLGIPCGKSNKILKTLFMNCDPFLWKGSYNGSTLADRLDFFKSLADSVNYDAELGKKVFYNLIQYGCLSWYDWCLKNWGTKWTAEDTLLTDNVFTF